MREKLHVLLGLILIGLFIWMAYVAIIFVFSTFQELDPKIILGIIGVVATIVSSVWIASYNARKAKEKIVYEAHREKKAKIYNDFMDNMVIKVMQNMRENKDGDDVLPNNLESFFDDFTAKLIIYGGSDVINAYTNFRNSSNDDNSIESLENMDLMFRAMRKDLGESNKNIGKNSLMSLYIIGGKEEISRLRE